MGVQPGRPQSLAELEKYTAREVALAERTLGILFRRSRKGSQKAKLQGGSAAVAGKAIEAIAEIRRRLESGLDVDQKLLATLAESLGGRSVPIAAIQDASRAAESALAWTLLALFLGGGAIVAASFFFLPFNAGPPTHSISGKIFLDRKTLLQGIELVFHPVDAAVNEGRPLRFGAFGDGRFEAKLPEGNYKVVLECVDAPKRIPSKYRSTESTPFSLKVHADLEGMKLVPEMRPAG